MKSVCYFESYKQSQNYEFLIKSKNCCVNGLELEPKEKYVDILKDNLRRINSYMEKEKKNNKS